MRVLIASTRGRPACDRLAAFARALAARRHDVTWAVPAEAPAPNIPALRVEPGRTPERTAAALALRVGRDLLGHRPDAAILRLSPGIAATAGLLAAARVPVVLDADDTPRDADGLPPEGERTALHLALRAAAAVIAASPDAAARAAQLGGPTPRVLGTPGDAALPDLLPGTRDDARAALDVPPDQPLLGHTGLLDASARLELLHEAHRHAAGVGLLVVGHGPRASFAHAMTMSTRPSSPVLVLPPEAAPVALWAANALVWLGPARASPALDALALGRRLVLLDRDAHLEAAYDPALHAVHVAAEATPRTILAAMEAALAADRQHGPLPREAVMRARDHLDHARHLVTLLESVRR